MNNGDKTYKIYISDTEFEVSEAQYKAHHKIMEHSKYLRKEERKVTILSYEGLMEELNVDSIVADESVNVEERAISNVMIDELRKILMYMPLTQHQLHGLSAPPLPFTQHH